MLFEARQLRVQLPCGPVTVIEAERHDAEVKARRFTGWGNLLIPPGDDDCSDCGSESHCGPCSGETKGVDWLTSATARIHSMFALSWTPTFFRSCGNSSKRGSRSSTRRRRRLHA